MATDKLINHSQGESIISQLDDIATNLQNVTAISPAKFGMGYAVCDTAAGTAAKTANIANYTLTEGALVTVKFTNANTASNATLNLNNTGAKPILYKGSALTTDIISAGDICTFIYSTANSGSYNIINIDALSGAGAGTVKSVGAEGGIITDQTAGAAISTTGSVKLNLKSDTAFASVAPDPVTTANRIYPVALDSAGHPAVDVPWTDTTYTQATNSAITVDNTNHTIDVATGTTSAVGVVQLTDSYSSTSATTAATPNAVKVAYDLANGKYAKPNDGIPKTDLAAAVQTSLTAADNAVPNTRTVNSKALSDNITLSGDDILLTGYNKGSSTAAVAATDKVNEAIAKHENRLNQQNSDFVVAENNILYNLNMGVKNIINIYGTPTSSQRGITYTNMGDGSYNVNGTVTTTPSYLDMLYDIPLSTLHLSINDQMVITTNSNTVGLMITARYADGTTGYNSVGTAASPFMYTIPNNTVALIIRLCVEGVGTQVNDVIVKPMFCKLDAWNQSHDYQSPALPNCDLTRLAIEDRTALAEEIDAGAKNRLDFVTWAANVNVTRGTKTVSGNSITLTATGNDCSTKWNPGDPGEYIYKIPVTAGEKLVLSWNANTSTTGKGRVFVFYSGVAETSVYTDANNKALEATIPSGCTFITFRFGVETNGDSITYSNIMLCTKAAFGVSSKFVPYRPNWDLVATDHVTLNTDTLILRQTLQAGTDFNNIITSGFYKYNGGPANTPNHSSSDFGILIVSRSDNYISQICHQFNGDVHFYVRQSTDAGNTWGSWTS